MLGAGRAPPGLVIKCDSTTISLALAMPIRDFEIKAALAVIVAEVAPRFEVLEKFLAKIPTVNRRREQRCRARASTSRQNRIITRSIN